jgi:hypothetical protein
MQAESVSCVCPECGWVQKFRPQKEWNKIKGDHRTKCNKCGRSFKVKDRIKDKLNNHRRKEDEDERPFGFFKYTKNS